MITESFVEHTYRLYLHEALQPTSPIRGSELLLPHNLRALLERLAIQKSSPSVIITASLFAKYYAYLIVSGPLYILSHHQEPLDLSIENTSISIKDEFTLQLYVHEQSALTFDQTNDSWKRLMIRSIYYHNLARVFAELNRVSQISMQTLWSHASFSTQWCYDQWIYSAPDEEMKHSLRADLELIFREIPSLYTTKVIDHPLFPDQKLRLRRDCCLNHCLPEGNYCTTCPNINSETRIVRLTEYNAKKPNR